MSGLMQTDPINSSLPSRNSRYQCMFGMPALRWHAHTRHQGCRPVHQTPRDQLPPTVKSQCKNATHAATHWVVQPKHNTLLRPGGLTVTLWLSQELVAAALSAAKSTGCASSCPVREFVSAWMGLYLLEPDIMNSHTRHWMWQCARQF